MFEQYTYTILRYRHDPASGEQINVGVVLWAAKSQFFGAKINKNYGRINKIFPSLDGHLLKKDLSKIERSFNKMKNELLNQLPFDELNAEILARKVLEFDDTSLVWAPLRSGLCKDPEQELLKLSKRFVLQYETDNLAKRTDSDVWKPFREKLELKYQNIIFEKKTISTDLDEIEFEHSYKNGKWHCFQPLSFDLSSEEGVRDKAARWSGHMVGLKNSSESFQTYFLVGRPENENLVDVFERGVNLLVNSPSSPRVIFEHEFESFANEISDVINHNAQLKNKN